jgi:hypothetical protein
MKCERLEGGMFDGETWKKTNVTGHRMLAVVPLEILVGLRVVLPELLDDVLAHICVVLLDFPGDFELVLGRHLCHLTALAHQVEHELRDVPPGDRDVLDRAADHVAFGAGDDVRDAIARVDDRARERSVRHAVRGPGRGKCQHGLDSDVQPLDVKRLEEDLASPREPGARIKGAGDVATRCEDGLFIHIQFNSGAPRKGAHSPHNPMPPA